MSFHLVARKMDGRHGKDTAGLCEGPRVVTIRENKHDVPATTRSPYCTLTLNPPRRGLSHPLFTDEETEADRAGNQPKTSQRVSGTPGIQTPPSWFQSHHTALPYVSSTLAIRQNYREDFITDAQALPVSLQGSLFSATRHLDTEVDLFPSALPLW